MPGKDGTGPIGEGSMTGRGSGLCIGADAVRHGAGSVMRSGLGLACRRGFGGGFRRDFVITQNSAKTHKDLLEKQKELLESRLEAIDKQLDNL